MNIANRQKKSDRSKREKESRKKVKNKRTDLNRQSPHSQRPRGNKQSTLPEVSHPGTNQNKGPQAPKSHSTLAFKIEFKDEHQAAVHLHLPSKTLNV